MGVYRTESTIHYQSREGDLSLSTSQDDYYIA